MLSKQLVRFSLGIFRGNNWTLSVAAFKCFHIDIEIVFTNTTSYDKLIKLIIKRAEINITFL